MIESLFAGSWTVSYCIRLGQCASSLALLIQLRQDTSDVVYIQQGLRKEKKKENDKLACERCKYTRKKVKNFLDSSTNSSYCAWNDAVWCTDLKKCPHLNMLLARSTWWDEHQAGQCVGLETNFVELGSNGVHIKIQEKGTPTKGFREIFQILFSFGCHTQEGERLVVGIITYLVRYKQVHK